jgi:hypothetical protein
MSTALQRPSLNTTPQIATEEREVGNSPSAAYTATSTTINPNEQPPA